MTNYTRALIQIKKQDRYSFDIVLNDAGVTVLLNFIANSSKGVELYDDSVGFGGTKLTRFLIKQIEGEVSFLDQKEHMLIFLLSADEREYLIFRLNQCLKDSNFAPPELFNLVYREADITFYLKPFKITDAR